MQIRGKHKADNEVAVIVQIFIVKKYCLNLLQSKWEGLQKEQITAKLLWDLQSQTDKQVKMNQAVSVMRDKEEQTENPAIPFDAHIQSKKHENLERFQVWNKN